MHTYVYTRVYMYTGRTDYQHHFEVKNEVCYTVEISKIVDTPESSATGQAAAGFRVGLRLAAVNRQPGNTSLRLQTARISPK